MPHLPPKPCYKHPLILVTKQTPCDLCKNSPREPGRRENACKRGYDARWRKARLIHLKANPLCVHHERQGNVVAATVVDHEPAHKGDMTKFWDRSTWQSLCKQCHDIKTATEDGAFGNKPTRKGCDQAGIPLDPNHHWR